MPSKKIMVGEVPLNKSMYPYCKRLLTTQGCLANLLPVALLLTIPPY